MAASIINYDEILESDYFSKLNLSLVNNYRLRKFSCDVFERPPPSDGWLDKVLWFIGKSRSQHPPQSVFRHANSDVLRMICRFLYDSLGTEVWCSKLMPLDYQ